MKPETGQKKMKKEMSEENRQKKHRTDEIEKWNRQMEHMGQVEWNVMAGLKEEDSLDIHTGGGSLNELINTLNNKFKW